MLYQKDGMNILLILSLMLQVDTTFLRQDMYLKICLSIQNGLNMYEADIKVQRESENSLGKAKWCEIDNIGRYVIFLSYVQQDEKLPSLQFCERQLIPELFSCSGKLKIPSSTYSRGSRRNSNSSLPRGK